MLIPVWRNSRGPQLSMRGSGLILSHLSRCRLLSGSWRRGVIFLVLFFPSRIPSRISVEDTVEDTDVGVGFVAGGAYMPWSMRCAGRPGAVQHLVLRVLGRMCEARDRTVRHG